VARMRIGERGNRSYGVDCCRFQNASQRVLVFEVRSELLLPFLWVTISNERHGRPRAPLSMASYYGGSAKQVKGLDEHASAEGRSCHSKSEGGLRYRNNHRARVSLIPAKTRSPVWRRIDPMCERARHLCRSQNSCGRRPKRSVRDFFGNGFWGRWISGLNGKRNLRFSRTSYNTASKSGDVRGANIFVLSAMVRHVKPSSAA